MLKQRLQVLRADSRVKAQKPLPVHSALPTFPLPSPVSSPWGILGHGYQGLGIYLWSPRLHYAPHHGLDW